MVAKALSPRQKPKAPSLTFSWEGRNRDGKTLRGETRATAEAGAVIALRRQGIVVTRIRKQRRKSRGGRIKDSDISLFTRQLSTTGA